MHVIPRLHRALVIILCGGFLSLYGADATSRARIGSRGDISVLAKEIVSEFIAGRPSTAADKFAAASDIPSQSIGKLLENLGASRVEMVKRLGKSVSVEVVSAKTYAKCVGVDVLLERFDRGVLLWSFSSCQSGDGSWILLGMKTGKADEVPAFLDPDSK